MVISFCCQSSIIDSFTMESSLFICGFRGLLHSYELVKKIWIDMQYVMKKTNYTYIMSPKNIKEHCCCSNNLLVPLNIEPSDLKWFHRIPPREQFLGEKKNQSILKLSLLLPGHHGICRGYGHETSRGLRFTNSQERSCHCWTIQETDGWIEKSQIQNVWNREWFKTFMIIFLAVIWIGISMCINISLDPKPGINWDHWPTCMGSRAVPVKFMWERWNISYF